MRMRPKTNQQPRFLWLHKKKLNLKSHHPNGNEENLQNHKSMTLTKKVNSNDLQSPKVWKKLSVKKHWNRQTYHQRNYFHKEKRTNHKQMTIPPLISSKRTSPKKDHSSTKMIPSELSMPSIWKVRLYAPSNGMLVPMEQLQSTQSTPTKRSESIAQPY